MRRHAVSARMMGNVMGEKRLIFYVVKSLGVADEDDLGRHGGCRDEMGGCSVCMLDGQRCGEGGRRRLVRGRGWASTASTCLYHTLLSDTC